MVQTGCRAPCRSHLPSVPVFLASPQSQSSSSKPPGAARWATVAVLPPKGSLCAWVAAHPPVAEGTAHHPSVGPRMVFGAWFLVPLAWREGSRSSRKQEAALTHPPHITSPRRAQISHATQNWEIFPGGGCGRTVWDSEGGAGTSSCSSPAGLAATLEPPLCCLLLLLPKLQQNRWEWHARKAGLVFVFCFFSRRYFTEENKSIRASGRVSRCSPSMDINGFSYL